MSQLGFPFSGLRPRLRRSDDTIEQVMPRRPLHRVLAFTGQSIDDVVNSPIAKNHVLGYFKLYKWIQRGSEIVELEKQWSGRRSR